MPKRTRRFLVGFLLIAAVGVAIFLFQSRWQSLFPKVTATGEVFAVTQRTMAFSVNATGVLRATSNQNFGAPPEFGNYWQFQIVNMAAEGKQVKSGDQLIGFDAQKVRDDLQRFQNELDQANKELEKTRSQIDLERQELMSRLAAAENNHEKLKLKQTNDPKFDVPNKVEEDKLAFEQARREVEALKERVEWHKKSSEATYQIIASKKARAENKVNDIKRGMENFQAKADREGVVIYKTKWNGERFQVGENVWSGQSILEIPDLNTIIVEAFVPEVDIGKVKIGQRAEITIDAFQGKSYTGTIKSIGTLIRPKAWDIPNKILDVQIALDQLDTAIMRPGMSNKTKIETAAVENCLAVPLKSVRATAEGALVKVKTEQGWQERTVKLGDSNGTEVIITEGLKAGDRIASDFAKAK
jgi:HlyD family secretion protein